MIAHKHVEEQGVLHASDKREALRTQAEAFITQAIEPEQVLSVNEMSVPMNNVFSLTVWYLQD